MVLAEKLLIYMGRNGFLSVMNLISISLFAWIHSSNSSLLELHYNHVQQAHNLHLNDNKLPLKGKMWNLQKISSENNWKTHTTFQKYKQEDAA